ncbi:MAG: hypothetical protein SFZ02_05245 [bacterium]|nr:hypothetical protein [bacterium]
MIPITNIILITILGIFLAIFWLFTTILFVRMVRRNDAISETAKTIWSILIVIYWAGGALGYLIWAIIWRIADKPATQKLSG